MATALEQQATRLRKSLVAPAVLAVSILVGFALVLLVRRSLMPIDGVGYAPGWSLRHFEAFFTEPFFVSVMAETVGAALLVTAITALIGFPLAYRLARSGAGARRMKLFILILPLSLSLVVNVFGWMVILGRGGLVNSFLVTSGLLDQPAQLLFNWTAVVIVLVHTFLPFQVLSIMGVIVQIDPALEHAAASLRASRWTTFRRVIIPLAFPGLLAGSTIVFMLTISAFVTPRMIGGTRAQMLGSLIYEQMLVVLNWSFAAAMSVVLLVLAIGIPALVMRLASRRSAARVEAGAAPA